MKNLFKSAKLKTAALAAGLLSVAGIFSYFENQKNQENSIPPHNYLATINTQSAFSDGAVITGYSDYRIDSRDIDSLASIRKVPAPVLVEEFRQALETALDERYDAVISGYSYKELSSHYHEASNPDCSTERCLPFQLVNDLAPISDKTTKEMKQKTGVRATFIPRDI